MTLLVGVLCEDGIVLGADSTATMVTVGLQRTARQSMSKLTIIEPTVVVGTSGPVGLGQRFLAEVRELWKCSQADAANHPILKEYGGKRLEKLTPERAMTAMRMSIANHYALESRIAGQLAPAAQQTAIPATYCTMVVAMPVEKQLCLFQFDQHGAPEQVTKKLPVVALGSGQVAADPFLSYLRKILSLENDSLPTLQQGRFLAQWTLQYVIDIDPGGVGGPIQLVTLQNKPDGSGTHATEHDTEEGAQLIDELTKKLRDFVQGIGKPGAGAAPPPEPLPS